VCLSSGSRQAMGTALYFFAYPMIVNNTLSKTSNVLCEGWQPKTT